MLITEYVSLSLLVLLLGTHLGVRPLFSRQRRLFFAATVFIMFAALAYQSRLLFFAWQKAEPPLNYLVPPYAPLSYFLKTIWTRFFAGAIIALGIALLILLLIHLMGKERRERIFEIDESIRIALSIFLLGQPNWIIYLLCGLILYVLLTAISTLRSQRKIRVSFSPFWLPLAILIQGSIVLWGNPTILAVLRLS